jgi:hypothetical protein
MPFGTAWIIVLVVKIFQGETAFSGILLGNQQKIGVSTHYHPVEDGGHG